MFSRDLPRLIEVGTIPLIMSRRAEFPEQLHEAVGVGWYVYRGPSAIPESEFADYSVMLRGIHTASAYAPNAD